MSETVPPAGVGRLHAELASYGPSTLTVRLLQAMLTVLPNTEALPHYQTIDDAAGLVFGGIPADVLERARQITADGRVDQALFAARSIDTGDTGLTIVSGVRSAMALFFGSKQGRSEAVAQQQRADAALKALGLAYLITKLVPLPPLDRIELVRSVPAGQALINYYGAIEIAVPFGAPVSESAGRFVRDLIQEQGRAMADKLLGIVGRQGVADAQEMLGSLAEELDRAALAAAPHTAALAEQIRSVLPSYVTGAGDLFDLVAAGADALPCYRYLCARLAIESSLALAKHEQMPEVNLPVSPLSRPTAVVPDAPPLPVGLIAAATGSVPIAALRQSLPASLGESEEKPEVVPRPSATLIADLEDFEEGDEEESVPVAWPTAALPEANRLRGIFLEGAAGSAVANDTPWRMFTVEGIYSEMPPAVLVGIDWDTLRRSSPRVALYRREGENLTITDVGSSSSKPATRHTAVRSKDQSTLTMDGRLFRRMDWDLTGRFFEGTWRMGGEQLSLTNGGQVVRQSRTGQYTLGIGTISIVWEGGLSETLALLSDLKPSSRRPANVWFAGGWWRLD